MDNMSNSSELNETIWEYPFNPWHGVLAFFYAAIFIVAVPANLFIIVAMIKSGRLRHDPSTVYLLVLAVVDFFWALLTLPFYVATTILEGFKFGDTDAVRFAVCDFQSYVLAFCFGASVHLLALVAFDRFLLIVYAFRYNSIMKTWLAWILVVAVCIPPAVISSTPFYNFGEYFFYPVAGICLFHWIGETLYVVLYAGELTLPVICIITLSIITYVYIRKFLKKNHRRKSQYAIDVKGASRDHRTKQRALTRVFIALILVQVICLLPAILTALGGSAAGGFENIPAFLLQIDTVLLLSNMAANPIVQSIFRQDVRTDLRIIFNFVTCKHCRSKFNTMESGTANDSGASVGSNEKQPVKGSESTELLAFKKSGRTVSFADKSSSVTQNGEPHSQL